MGREKEDRGVSEREGEGTTKGGGIREGERRDETRVWRKNDEAQRGAREDD